MNRAAADPNAHKVTGENTYALDGIEQDVVLTISAFTEVFDSTIEQEDYRMGELQQRSAQSGQLEYVMFGRNEPALHHYHKHFREALGMSPLERLA